MVFEHSADLDAIFLIDVIQVATNDVGLSVLVASRQLWCEDCRLPVSCVLSTPTRMQGLHALLADEPLPDFVSDFR